MPLISKQTTVEPPNNESFGTANFFFIIWRFSLILRGTNLLKSMQMVHWKYFIMRGFSLLGEVIIRGSTVAIRMAFILTLLTLGIVIEHNEKVDCSYICSI